MKKIYTIDNILSLADGSWVSGEVFVTVSNIRPPNGRGPTTATLTDATGVIVGKFWGAGGIEHWAGKRVKLSGQGIQRKSYQNVSELSVGQKAEISFAGAPGTAAQQEDDIPGDPAPQYAPSPQTSPQAGYRPSPSHVSAARQVAPMASGTPRNGQTVGMVCKGAIDLWIATGGPQENMGGFGPDQIDQIEKIAESLFQMSERIQSAESPPF